MLQDQAFEKYRLLAALGHGGMADVYLATLDGPGGFNKLLVLKQLRPALAQDTEFVDMFLAEARLAARLAHPNIVQTYEVVGSDGGYFIVMEYLDGQPLQRIFSRSLTDVPISPGTALRLLIEALNGLHYAHELRDYRQKPLQIVHRDVSPHNLFVTYDGQVKVVDFGIAKAADSALETRVGLLKGKIGYMSPEQARADPLDRRADIFGIGVILWELLAGRRLWHGLPEVTVLKRLSVGEIPSLVDSGADVASNLVEICSRALAFEPDDRYPSALALRLELEAALAELGGAPTLVQIGDGVSRAFADERARSTDLLRRALGQPSSFPEALESDSESVARTPGSLSFSVSGDSARVVVSRPNLDETAVITPKLPAVGFDDALSKSTPEPEPSRRRGPAARATVALALLGVVVVAGWFAHRSEQARFGRRPVAPAALASGFAREPLGARITPGKALVEVSGDLDTDAVLGADRDYLLKFTTFVLPGVTLTIERGTTIYGDTATKGTLVVQPGGRIVARGTADEPIVFTSENVRLGTARPGDWGGLIVLGNAPTNLKDGNDAPVRGRIEGITSRGEYGGSVADDDSGALSYVRIEYSGTAIAPNNEINGLTLGGVGSKTSIHHVVVRHTADDCFEFFGGTVAATHLVCLSPGDDGFDWDYGYRGRLQFLVSASGATAEGESNGLEGDNDPNASANEPVSEPRIYNLTLVGPGHPSQKPNYGMLLRRGSRAHVGNALVTAFDAGLDIRDRTQLNLTSGAFFDNLPGGLAFVEAMGALGPLADDDFGFDEIAFMKDAKRNVFATDPGLGLRRPFALKPEKKLTVKAMNPPDDGFFDAEARFLGAFRDRSDDWDRGRWMVWQ